MFPSIIDTPVNIRLMHQEPDEHIELFLRQHWVTNLPWIITTFLGALLPLGMPLFKQFAETAFTINIPLKAEMSIVILWYMLILAFSLEHFLHWHFNIYIVTNKHLVDINFWNLLSRDITEVCLKDLQSAQSKITGITGSLFNFGDVTIETAAKGQSISFLAVPRPDFVADRIQNLQEEAVEEATNAP